MKSENLNMQKLERQSIFRLCALGEIDEQYIRHFWNVFEDTLIEFGVTIIN